MKRLILIFIFVSGINLFASSTNFSMVIYKKQDNYLMGYNQYLPDNYYIFNYELVIAEKWYLYKYIYMKNNIFTIM